MAAANRAFGSQNRLPLSRNAACGIKRSSLGRGQEIGLARTRVPPPDRRTLHDIKSREFDPEGVGNRDGVEETELAAMVEDEPGRGRMTLSSAHSGAALTAPPSATSPPRPPRTCPSSGRAAPRTRSLRSRDLTALIVARGAGRSQANARQCPSVTCPETMTAAMTGGPCPLGINVDLPPGLEELVRSKVASGLYTSASEGVREALRLMQEEDRPREAKLAQLRSDVRRGLASGPDEPWDAAAVKRGAHARRTS